LGAASKMQTRAGRKNRGTTREHGCPSLSALPQLVRQVARAPPGSPSICCSLLRLTQLLSDLAQLVYLGPARPNMRRIPLSSASQSDPLRRVRMRAMLDPSLQTILLRSPILPFAICLRQIRKLRARLTSFQPLPLQSVKQNFCDLH
jgi:hypothetical protein